MLLLITYPILQENSERIQRNQITENLNQILDCTDKYFENNPKNSVSLYALIGPQKEIRELKIIADEKYPETIFRGKDISAYSQKLGVITVKVSSN